ncbi:uncharacterized protein LOC132475602 [Gadus macrocephalus]|uniref:uncharacterized protein LOC132475602 n=1 Tax=Gadus macrocephalus TaxID=80720 RepID=UPI0028CB5C7C|nr:uncharacterized protein LOC132475602 [Gadus macrocephalus]
MRRCWACSPADRPNFSQLTTLVAEARPMEVQATRDFNEPRKLPLQTNDMVTVIEHGLELCEWKGQNHRTLAVGWFPASLCVPTLPASGPVARGPRGPRLRTPVPEPGSGPRSALGPHLGPAEGEPAASGPRGPAPRPQLGDPGETGGVRGEHVVASRHWSDRHWTNDAVFFFYQIETNPNQSLSRADWHPPMSQFVAETEFDFQAVLYFTLTLTLSGTAVKQVSLSSAFISSVFISEEMLGLRSWAGGGGGGWTALTGWWCIVTLYLKGGGIN